jgi:hypothetical protein
MKKIQFLSGLLVILLAIACKNTGSEATAPMADTTAAAQAAVDTMMAPMDTTAVAFACSMHPEVTGKEGDKCSKCGMALVSVKKAEPGHEGHNH